MVFYEFTEILITLDKRTQSLLMLRNTLLIACVHRYLYLSVHRTVFNFIICVKVGINLHLINDASTHVGFDCQLTIQTQSCISELSDEQLTEEWDSQCAEVHIFAWNKEPAVPCFSCSLFRFSYCITENDFELLLIVPSKSCNYQ